KNKNVITPQFKENKHAKVDGRYKGIVEINSKHYGFIREMDHVFSYDSSDVFVDPDDVKHHNLRPGLILEGEYEEDSKGRRRVHSIEKINERNPVEWQRATRFELQTTIMPTEQDKLSKEPENNHTM